MEIWVGGEYIYILENKSTYHMNTKHKEFYDAPSTMVLEIKIEGIICQSRTDYNYGNLDEPNDVMSLMDEQEFIF